MSRSNNRKIAVTLLGALAFGASDASAMNTSKNRTQNPQTVGTVGGVRNQTKKINWKKIAKIGGFSVAGLVALEAVHSAIGGFTDSKFGNYSIGRAIKNYVNKNKQPGPEDEDPEDKNKKKTVEQGDKEKEKEKTARDQILEKFRQAWNNDDTWEDFKVKFSKMMDHVIVLEKSVDNQKNGVEAIKFFASVFKGENVKFTVERCPKSEGFMVKKVDGTVFCVKIVNKELGAFRWKLMVLDKQSNKSRLNHYIDVSK